MELEEIRAPQRRFSHSLRAESFGREGEGEEAPIRGARADNSSLVGNMTEYHHHHHHQIATTVYDPSSYRRPSQASPNAHHHHRRGSSESHPWARSRSVSSLSNVSCESDSETTKFSTKSSPIGSDFSMGNYYYGQTDSGALPVRTISCEFPGGERGAVDRMDEWSRASSPSAEELSEVFEWVDENNDGVICGSDLRSFMSRVLAFEISEDEAESLLLFYGNGRTLRTGSGAVVDLEAFLSLYQCLCGEQASPEEESMMAAASRVFDKTNLQSDRWA